MRSSYIAVLLAAVAFSLAGFGIAKSQPIPCDDVDQYSVDTVTTAEAVGLPGTTVNVPVVLKNNSPIAAFEIYMEYDFNVINPVTKSVDTIIDTAYVINVWVDTVVVGSDTTYVTYYDTLSTSIDTLISRDYEYQVVDTSLDITETGGVRLVEEIDFPSTGSLKRMRLYLFPRIDPFDPPQNAVRPGRHEVIRIPFAIDAGATVGTNTIIRYYRQTIYNDSVPPQQIGCLFSQYFDSTGSPTHRLKEANGVVRVQEPPDLPVINSFGALDSTVNETESTTLFWDVSNANTVSISPGIGTVAAVGQQQITPASTTTYTLTATNDDGTVTQSVTITVIPIGSNNRPVFTAPTQTSWTIEQGQTLAFSVTATDADNDDLTLTASNLPFNATFYPTNPVIGVGSVTGNFSFTPDFIQEGTFQVTFLADDGKAGGTRQLIVTIEVEPIPYDRLFTTSAEGQRPKGGLPGARTVLIPINLVTAQTVYGVQFDFIYDDEYFVVDSVITTARTLNWVIYENAGQTPGLVRIVTFGVANEPVADDTSTAILYVVMSIDSSALPGDYPILIEDGWESTNPNPDYPSLPLQTDGGIIQVDRLGDVNLDKRVDVADAVNVVGYILGSFGFSPRQFAAGDVVKDTAINVLDLVAIINLIFGIPPSPVAGHYIAGELAKVSLDYPDLYAGSREELVVRSELPEQIAGVQLELLYDPSTIDVGQPGLGADAQQMVLSSKDDGIGGLTVLLYFKNPYRTQELIQAGEAELLRVPIEAAVDIEYGDESQLRLSRAMLSTPEAAAVRIEGMDDLPLPNTFVLQQNYPNPFNPTTTIEFSLGGSAEGSLTQAVKLEVYNILGQQVATLVDDRLPPGKYQVEWDSSNRNGQPVASGIYLYRLQVDNESESKKMVLLK